MDTVSKGVATVAVCAAGAVSMWLTLDNSTGPTGIGWAVLGVLIIWGS